MGSMVRGDWAEVVRSGLSLQPTVFLWFNVPPQFIVPPSLGAGACAPLRCTPPLGGLVVP